MERTRPFPFPLAILPPTVGKLLLIHDYLLVLHLFPAFLSVILVPFLYADTHFLVFPVFVPFMERNSSVKLAIHTTKLTNQAIAGAYTIYKI